MEKNYFYVVDQVDNKQFIVEWYPGQENLADYLSKHHEAKHHKEVRKIYLHDKDSPRVLQRDTQLVARVCWNWAQGWHETSPIDPAPRTMN